MKKTYRYIIMTVILITILIGVMYYLLIPKNRIDMVYSVEDVTTEKIMKNFYIEEFKILPKGLKASADIVLSKDTVNNITNLIKNKIDNKNIQGIYSETKNEKIKIYVLYKLINLIDTQIELDAIPKIDHNNLIIRIDNVKIGKLKISNEIVEKIVNEKTKEIGIDSKGNYIIINKDKLNPFKLESIKVNEKNINLTVEIPIKDLGKIK